MQLACIMAERLAIQNCERCDAEEACQLECFPGLCVQRRLAQEGFGEIRRACAGSLPSSWSSLSNLTMLSLASNSLTGALTWRNITSLCPTDLKHTQLCQITLPAVQICCSKVHALAVQVACPASGPT